MGADTSNWTTNSHVEKKLSNWNGRVVKTKLKVLDEKLIEWLQQKLITNTTNIPIFKTYHRSSSDKDIVVKNNFDKNFAYLYNFFKQKWSINAWTWNQYISNSSFNNWIHIFKIKSVYTQDEYYVLEDTEWHFFNVNISDFDTNWVKSNSLMLWKPPLNTQSNLVSGFTIDNTPTSINLIKEDKIYSTLVWDLIVVVNKDIWDLIIVNNNLIEYINIDSNWKQVDWNPISHPFWTIEKMRIDHNSNFLLFISNHTDWVKRLHIVNRKTLKEIISYDNISDILQIDNNNSHISCITSDWKIASMNVNFEQFDVWYVDTWDFVEQRIVQVTDASKEALITALSNWWLKIDVSQLSLKWNDLDTVDKSNQTIIDQIWQTKIWEKTLKELFDDAISDEQIEIVYKALLQIKSNPLIAQVNWITNSIEKSINEKRFKIKLQKVDTNINKSNEIYQETIKELEWWNLSVFPNLLTLQIKINEIKKERAQLPISDTEIDKKINELLNNIDNKIIEFRQKNNEIIIKSINDNINKIWEIVSKIEYITHITQIYSSDLYIQTEKLIDLLEDYKKIELKDKLNEQITSRIKKLWELEKDKDEKENEKIKELIEEIEDMIINLSEVVNSIDDETVLNSIKNTDPLITSIKTKLEKIPISEKERLNIAIDNIFNERLWIIKMNQINSIWLQKSLDEYWIDTSLYYTDIKKNDISFKLGWKRTALWEIRLELEYEWWIKFDIDTYLINPSKYAHAMVFDDIKWEMSQSDFIKIQNDISSWNRYGKKRLKELVRELNKCSKEDDKKKIIDSIHQIKRKYIDVRKYELFAKNLAKKLELNPRTNLKAIDPNFIVLEEEKKILERLSSWFKIQKRKKRWIEILEWPPGLWKTVMCEHIAAATNREVIRVQCYKDMEVTDLLFSDSLKAWETNKEIADWVKLMQKPWTLILFDEIDLLNPKVLQTLHRLFDRWRSVYHPQLWEIKSNTDCVFVWTCNSYDKLSNPIVSRSRIIKLTYPGELNEAYKVSKYTGIDFFQKLSFEDFKKLWENYWKQKSDEKNIIDKWIKEIYDNFDRIKKLVAFFNELRLKQSSEDYDEKFVYEISYRDASDIFDIFTSQEKANFKDIVSEVIIPKARKVVLENEDKDIQEKIINEIIDNIF